MSRLCQTLLLWLLAGCTLAAPTPADLLTDGKLKAEVVVESTAPHYQRGPIVIAVEVSTPRWFSRGTRVRDFRVPGAVVRPVSSFADNQSRRYAGESWSTQRWRFRIFPVEAGELRLPPLRVFVSVNSGEPAASEGELTLDAPTLSVVPPPGSEGLTDWVATRSLTVDERWEGLRDSYRPGDAVVRHRRMRAEEVPAMLLATGGSEAIDGLSLYPAPAQVTDRQDRGRLVGTREEKLVITLEAPGEFHVPGDSFPWFNTDTGTFERIELPGQTLAVEGSVAKQETESGYEPPPTDLLWLLIPGLLLIPAAAVARRSERLQALWRRLRRALSSALLCRAYLSALAKGDSKTALRLLHRRLTAQQGPTALTLAIAGESGLDTTLRQLLAHGYGRADTLPTRAAALQLWRGLAPESRSPRTTETLTLNPRRARSR